MPRDGDGAVRAAATFVDSAFGDDFYKKGIGFRRSDPCKLSCTIDIGILRLGPFGANSELEFIGGLIVDLCELAAPIAGNAWLSRSRQFDGCEIEIIDGLPDWSSRTSVETAGTGTGNPRRSPW